MIVLYCHQIEVQMLGLNIVKQTGLNEARGDIIFSLLIDSELDRKYVLAGMRVGIYKNAKQTDWCM